MMTLQDQLNQLKAGFEEKAPPEALEVMHRATSDLRNSGILDQCLHFTVANGDPIATLSWKLCKIHQRNSIPQEPS